MNPRSIVVFALFASCAAAPSRPVAPELRTSLPLQYHASLASQGLAAADAREPGTRLSERRLELEVVVLRCSAREADERLGERAAQPMAWVVSAETATDWLATLGERVTAPRLSVFDGQHSHFAVSDERAYVSRFDVAGDGATMVADPVVDTLRQGLSFDLCASVVDRDALELELEWRICELDEDLPEISHKLPFGDTPVVVQVPLAMNQQLTTHARLRAGERMVLSCRGADGQQRIAVVSASALDG
jgi:hypothetical protein